MDEQHSTARERFDEPPPRPAASDVIEAIVDALERAIDLAAPALSTVRTLNILARLRAWRPDGDAQLIASLERLSRDWRQS